MLSVQDGIFPLFETGYRINTELRAKQVIIIERRKKAPSYI